MKMSPIFVEIQGFHGIIRLGFEILGGVDMKKSGYIIVIILIIITFCSCAETQKPPKIESGEFPFHFIYELNGETHDIEDTVVCEFRGYDGSAWFTKSRSWNEYLKSGVGRISIIVDENINSVLNPQRVNSEIEVFLDYGSGDYYMGDPNARSLIHGKPHVCYRERYNESEKVTVSEATILSEKQLEELFGIKIIEFSFSTPIKNTFETIPPFV